MSKHSENKGWQILLDGYPWFRCNGCYDIPAYSEFMPSPFFGRQPYGNIDDRFFDSNDLYGWKISEMEQQYEINPGLEHASEGIIENIIKLGKGKPVPHISGHGDMNLKNNPYWPEDLSSRAGRLKHERYVILLPVMLSRTQDDKGRIFWTLFGNSIHDPGVIFWKSFYNAPGSEKPASESVQFFTGLINVAYGEKTNDKASLHRAGFRIMISDDTEIPQWAREFLVANDKTEEIRYLLTFLPFSSLPESIRKAYLSGKICLLPFPGSLVFWGMPGYLKLASAFRLAAQIPLAHLVTRHTGIGGVKVTQSGWIHEPHPDKKGLIVNNSLIHDSYHKTHRWQKVHRYQDELNEEGRKVKMIKALFSTEPDAMGLYDKPLAANSHLWDHDFRLILNGPEADKKELDRAEEIISGGGLFGYRIFYPPMRVGFYNIYLHKPLVAYIPKDSRKHDIKGESLNGYITGYHIDDNEMENPVEMWPRMMRRELYLSALNDFSRKIDHYSHQTALNTISLLEAWELQDRQSLEESFAYSILNISKHKSLDQWLDKIENNSADKNKSKALTGAIREIIAPPDDFTRHHSITYSSTARRDFEEAWWNGIKVLAHGKFRYKDNADIARDEKTLSQLDRRHRDLDSLGDYLMMKHRQSIESASMEGKALCGELPFRWRTLFDFPCYGGWIDNQEKKLHERDIMVIIPGKNRNKAVVLCDHYDTAYMEDVYSRQKGGSGARIPANGADDNYSSTSTLLMAAPIYLQLSREGRLENDIWLVHLTGEEFPADCLGSRNFCTALIEKKLILRCDGNDTDLSGTDLTGVFIMDMIGHNNDSDRDVFQICPGRSPGSMELARQAHIANYIWNAATGSWNKSKERKGKGRGKRVRNIDQIPGTAKHLSLKGEIRTHYNPRSSIYNSDAQIFSDTGVPVVLFMENYDIDRSGYHDSKDTMENIDLDYGAALASIVIETVARIATAEFQVNNNTFQEDGNKIQNSSSRE